MAIDRFALCPGGTGKKIKFCHNECVGFLEKIQKLMDGEQIRAALQLVDQTLARDPDRSCAWSYKCLLERATGNVEQFARAAEEFVQRFPKNPVALAEQSLSYTFQGRVSNALEYLSRSLEASEEQQIVYMRQSSAAATLGEALVKFDHIPPAVEILAVFLRMHRDRQSPVSEMLNQIESATQIPLEVREVQWDGLFASERYQSLMEVADRLAVHFKWRELENYLREYLNREPEDARVWHYLGVVLMWLMNYQEAAEAFARAGQLEKNDRLAVFSLCRSLILSADPFGDREDVYDVDLVVDDPDRLKEALLSDRQVLSQRPQSRESLRWFFRYDANEEVLPELILAVLRRPIANGQSEGGRIFAEAGEPPVIGFASYYGRQTDCPARLLFGQVYESDLECLKNMAKGWLGQENIEWSRKRIVPDRPRLMRMFLDSAALADLGLSLDLKEEWKTLVFKWLPGMTFKGLEGSSLAEASQDPQKRRWAMAILTFLGTRFPNKIIKDCVEQLSKQLGLDFQDDLDVDVNRFRRMPLSLVRMLDPTRLSIDSLARFYTLAVSYEESELVNRLAREIIRRKDEDGVPPMLVQSAYLRMFDELSDLEESELNELSALFAEGMAYLEKHHLPHDEMHIAELQLAFADKGGRSVKPILEHMMAEHSGNEQVMEFVQRIMSFLSFVAHSQEQGERSPPESQPGGGIWTPDSEAGGAGSQKKLWVPGVD